MVRIEDDARRRVLNAFIFWIFPKKKRIDFLGGRGQYEDGSRNSVAFLGEVCRLNREK